MEIKKAVVLVSGGLDSATVLAMASKQGFACHCLAFDYGQRHRSELDAGQRVSDEFGASAHKLVKLDLQAIGGSALTDDSIAVPEGNGVGEPSSEAPSPKDPSSNIPVTYVPARNTVFLSIALGWAEVLGATDIFIGVNAVDYSGYPDCRPEYIAAFENMANLATRASVEGQPFHIHTPLISMTKAEIIKQGVDLGVDYSLTVSCYQASSGGLACGRCDSCQIRQQGFAEAQIPDPTRYK
ncbi:MAG: 7-cyano-7-deazaguanine synthase QueC [Porticoccaceae bacterium]|nr:7-cyano-7-deazaguanine synthase QueC [Porticoccaceae bacterium]